MTGPIAGIGTLRDTGGGPGLVGSAGPGGADAVGPVWEPCPPVPSWSTARRTDVPTSTASRITAATTTRQYPRDGWGAGADGGRGEDSGVDRSGDGGSTG